MARARSSRRAGRCARRSSGRRWCSGPRTGSSTSSPPCSVSFRWSSSDRRTRSSSPSTLATSRGASSTSLEAPGPAGRAYDLAGPSRVHVAGAGRVRRQARRPSAADHRPRAAAVVPAGVGNGVRAGEAAEPRQLLLDEGRQRVRRAAARSGCTRRRSRRSRRSICRDSFRARAIACSATTPAESPGSVSRSRRSSSRTRTTRPGRCGRGCCCGASASTSRRCSSSSTSTLGGTSIARRSPSGPRAGTVARRRADLGLARHRRGGRRALSRADGLAARSPGAQGGALDFRRDALRVPRAAQRDADEHPRRASRQGHERGGRARPRSHRRQLDDVTRAFRPGGEMLFGAFTAADAFYAPVVTVCDVRRRAAAWWPPLRRCGARAAGGAGVERVGARRDRVLRPDEPYATPPR